MKYKISDFHNDLPSIIWENDNYDIKLYNEKHHTDIPRLKAGNIALQFFAACPCSENQLLYSYESAMNIIGKFKEVISLIDGIELVNNHDELVKVTEQGKIASVLALEGGHAIENSLDKLEMFYNTGVRYITITWNNSHDWAVSAMDERSHEKGLSEFGRTVIRKMNSLKMMIDVSHTGIKTIEDILEVSEFPVVATHTGARKLNNHPRNLYDEQIKNISEAGGIFGVVFYPPFLHATGNAKVDEVINHIDYIASLVGVDHLALGSDFDGIGTNTVSGLEDVSKFPEIIEMLEKRGFSSKEIEKIVYLNTVKVFKNICG